VALFLVDGYDVQIPASRVRSLVVVAKAAPVVSFLGFLAFFAQPYRMARPVILFSVLFGTVVVAGMRLTLARLLLSERFAKQAILAAVETSPVLTDILHEARFEYRVVGIVGDTLPSSNGWRHLGPVDQLPAIVRLYGAHEVIIGTEPIGGGNAVEACFEQGIRVVRAGDLFERYKGRVQLASVDETWFQNLPMHDLSSRPYLVVRRATDIILSALLGVPFLIALPFIATFIKLDSPGPVFFRQGRVGQFGRRIFVLKLRTMRGDAELSGFQWAERRDPRVTRVGRFLRATRMDELPQLVNVFRGDMSFIGPRPERPEFVADLERLIPHYRARLAVKPGISGWAQVKDGYASSVDDSRRKLEYDLYYVKHQCLRLDLQIVLHTLFTVMGLRGR